jgi:cytochrome c-type biogenesis protein CcmH/NrfG
MVSSGYLELGMFEDAARTLDDIELEPRCRKERVSVHLNVCIAAEKWDTAAKIAASLVQSEPENPATWLTLASVVMRTAHVEQVEPVLFKAYRWHPKIVRSILSLAREAAMKARLGEAKIWLRCAIHLQENNRGLALEDEVFEPLWQWIKGEL